MGTFVVAMTGASGAIYGLTLLRELVRARQKIHFVISPDGLTVLREETGVVWEPDEEGLNRDLRRHFPGSRITAYDPRNFYAPIASGSALTDGMVIAPCSMKTIAGIASGYSASLIERAADVTIKERRPLVLVPRETPLSAIHLENLHRLSLLGVTILPAMPGFYQKPKTIEDLANFVVGRILDNLKIRHNLYPRWGS